MTTETLNYPVLQDAAQEATGKAEFLKAEEKVDVSSLKDYELTTRSAKGDMIAFEEIYQRHHRRVYSICLRMLKNTHAGTGFMHEAFDKDDPKKFTRLWFAWANTMFGELIVKLYEQRPHLLKLT